MKTKFLTTVVVAGVLAICGCSTHRQKTAVAATKTESAGIVIFMVGDSTMADKPVIPANPERGWGQLLPGYFKPGVRVENHAANGRSSKSFLDEGKWRPVVESIKPGDCVIIQFGHNDQPGKGAKRETQPFGSYKTNLFRYVQETRERGGVPVLCTSVARRKFDAEGRLVDTHGDFIPAARQAAAELNVPLLDLNSGTIKLLTDMGPEGSKRLFDWIPAGEFERYPKELKDDTHFNAFGACRVCDLAVVEIKLHVPSLAVYLKESAKAASTNAPAVTGVEN
jgi:lysophospholipase L1-like esterase